MKQRYYFRGLGIGILVATMIVSLSAHNKKAMTDEEVKARAKQLGMVESTVLSNIGEGGENVTPEETGQAGGESDTAESDGNVSDGDAADVTEPEDGADATDSGETEPDVTVSGEADPAETEDPGEMGPDENVSDGGEPDITEPAEPEDGSTEVKVPEGTGDIVTLVINRGESSVTVSKSLEAAGLVENASKYDRFLCQNGYDKKLRVGTYEIPKGASEEEIAHIITGGNS